VNEVSTDVWRDVLDGVRERIGDQRFNLWFKNTRLVSIDDGVVKVGVPNVFIRGWLEENFSDLIEECVEKALGSEVTVKFEVAGSLFRETRQQQLADAESALDVDCAEDKVEVRQEAFEIRRDMRLDRFVVGPCNQLAYSAAMQIVQLNDPAFNPLFVHASVGLGKTHLLQGITNALAERDGSQRAIYVTAERWTNQYVAAVRSNQFDAFRHKYRNVDVLLIDDVHFLAHKRGIQEEFLHTFDALGNAHKCIVLASDVHPRKIKEFRETLISRFVAGMVVKLDPPDYQTRLAILKSKALARNKVVPEPVLQLIAERVTGNVRDLEGSLTSLTAYAALHRRPMTLALAQEALDGICERTENAISLQAIEDTVLSHFTVSKSDLRSRKRSKAVTLPRQLCMYLCRDLTEHTCKEIGDYFGGKNHTTVIFAENRIAQMVEADRNILELVKSIRTRFGK